jgi:hypothetical protein
VKRSNTNKPLSNKKIFHLEYFYREDNSDESEIMNTFNGDLRRPVNIIIIIKTKLQIRSLKEFMEYLYRTAKSGNRENIIMWVNKKSLKLN